MSTPATPEPGRKAAYPARTEFSNLLRTGALLAVAGSLMSCGPQPPSGQESARSAEEKRPEAPKADAPEKGSASDSPTEYMLTTPGETVRKVDVSR